MLPGFVSERLDEVLTPHDVAPTPGVNAPVAPPATPEPQLAPGHWLDDVVTGRADMLTAMMHPEVVADRMKAEQELAGRFQIVDGKTKGAPLPNQVTSAEFHKLANTYSDIRMGRGDLTIDAHGAKDEKQFRADMMNDIGDILQTKSGRYLVEHLSNATNLDENGNPVHHHTTLTPGVAKDGTPDTDFTDENPVDHNSEIGKNIVNDDGSPGTGKDTVVRSNPNLDINETDDKGNVVGKIRSDVALFHEMVHAYTDVNGFTEAGPITERDGAGAADLQSSWPIQRAEYQAAGLGVHKGDFLTENSYRQERHGVAQSGKGIAGDLLMPTRDRYMSVDDYKTIANQ